MQCNDLIYVYIVGRLPPVFLLSCHFRKMKNQVFLFKTEILQSNWYTTNRVSQMMLVAKNLPVNAGNIRDASLISESGRSPGGGHGNSFQYSCWEKSHGQRSLEWTQFSSVAQSDSL